MLKHRNITFIYRFFAESIIAFLIIYPFTFAYYHVSHYWSYLLIVFIIGSCFFLLDKYNLAISFYLLVLPIGMCLFYLFDFQLLLILLFPLLFIWRYITIRSYENQSQYDLHLLMLNRYNREMIYLHMTLIIGILDVIFAKEFFMVYYVILQIIILFGGNLLSHASLFNQKERKIINVNPFLLTPILLLFGSVVVYFVFSPFRLVVHTVWKIIQSTLLFLFNGIMWIVDMILPDFKSPTLTEEREDAISKIQEQTNEDIFEGFAEQTGIDDVTLAIIIIFIGIVLIGLLMIRALKNRRERLYIKVNKTAERPLDSQESNETNFFKRIFKRRPSHPIRSLIYTFERKADHHELGRYSYESIDEWFNRLEIDINKTSYEKVRYGYLDVSQQEIDELEQQLKTVDFDEIANNI